MSDASGCRGAILADAVSGYFEQSIIPVMLSSALGFQGTYCSRDKATDLANVAENVNIMSKLLTEIHCP